MPHESGGEAARRFVFTITPGRTGTRYLAELFQANAPFAVVHHELIGHSAWGLDTPEISNSIEFNMHGNTSKVREFWAKKFGRVAQTETPLYVETSHLLAKAGLMENIDILREKGEVYIVLLRRDPVKTVVSFLDRMAFVDYGAKLLWYLDEGYSKNLIDGNAFRKLGQVGLCIWYYYEMLARGYFYRELLKGREGLTFVTANLETITSAKGASAFLSQSGLEVDPGSVRIPDKANANPPSGIGERERGKIDAMIKQMAIDPEVFAAEHIEAGTRF